MGNNPKSIWDKLDIAIAAAGGTAQPGAPTATGKASLWNRWGWRIVNFWATLLWLYAVCKIFIFDIDSYLIGRLFPQGGWLVTYRFLVLLAFVALWGLVLGGKRFFAWALYFAFFPVIVVIWYLPRFIYKRQSWIVLLSVMNALTSFVRDFRYTLVTKVGAVLAIVVIIFSPFSPITLLAGGVLLLLLVVTYVRTLTIVLKPSRFITDQQAFIDFLLRAPSLTNLWTLKPELKDPNLVKFDPGQQTTFMTSVSYGVIFHRALYFWAYQLESYRKGSAPYLFSLLSYLWLFLQTLIGFSFVNFAIYREDTSAFSYTTPPQLFDFFHYSLNLMLVSSIDYLTARSQVAVALADLIRFSGPVLLITVLATFVLTLRQSRQDEQMRESIGQIKSRAREFDSKFEEQYDASVTEAIERLRQLPGSLVRVAAWFSRQIPADFG